LSSVHYSVGIASSVDLEGFDV